MTTPPRIVIDAQTSRAEHDRMVNVARIEAKHRQLLIGIMRIVIALLCIVGLSIAIFALAVLGVALLAVWG